MKRSMLIALLLALATFAPLRAQDIPLSKILVDKSDWREAADKLPDVTFLESHPGGAVTVFRKTPAAVLLPDGKISTERGMFGNPVREKSYGIVQADGWHYWIYPNGVAGEDIEARRLKQDKDRRPIVLKLPGLKSPSCLLLWPDEGHLVIGEADGAYLWAVRIEKDGSFGPGDRYYSLRTREGVKMHVTAMTMDASYLLYACTPIGIQVFDPTGRLSGVVPSPSKEPMTAIAIGGAKADELYVAAGDKIYARRIQMKASYTLKK